MRKTIYFLFFFICLNSTTESKNIKLNFIVWGIAGANYFSRNGINPWTGWGESYGGGGELQVIFRQENIGLGLEYINIYETAVVNIFNKGGVWIRKVNRNGFLLKLLFSFPKINPWIGFGKDIFNITSAVLEYELYGVHHKSRYKNLEGKEIFQIIAVGVDINIWKKFLLNFGFRYGTNETQNTLTANFQSLQFLFKFGYRFSK